MNKYEYILRRKIIAFIKAYYKRWHDSKVKLNEDGLGWSYESYIFDYENMQLDSNVIAECGTVQINPETYSISMNVQDVEIGIIQDATFPSWNDYLYYIITTDPTAEAFDNFDNLAIMVKYNVDENEDTTYDIE